MFLLTIVIVIFVIYLFYRFDKWADPKMSKEQEQEIKKYDNISDYLLNNKDKIKLVGAKNDLAFFMIGSIEIEIYLGSETFVKIEGIDFGHSNDLTRMLEDIYFKDREKFIIKR